MKILLKSCFVFFISFFVATVVVYAQPWARNLQPLAPLEQKSIQPKSLQPQTAPSLNTPSKCDPKKDIMLNTYVPFIGNCILKDPDARPAKDDPNNTTIGNAFPKLMGGLIRIVMTAIYIIGFLGILIGGFMITASGVDAGLKTKGKTLIVGVIAGLILLGASGVILNLINPNFFGTNS